MLYRVTNSAMPEGRQACRINQSLPQRARTKIAFWLYKPTHVFRQGAGITDEHGPQLLQ